MAGRLAMPSEGNGAHRSRHAVAHRGAVAMSLEAEIEAIVRRVVDERLRAVRLSPPDSYSAEHLPPDVKSRDRFHRLAKACPGARKVGRTWLVPTAAWHAFRAATAPTANVNEIVDRMLRAGSHDR
jgi:hypothetical protein